MHIEVQVALNFVISYLYNKLPRRRVNIFGEELEKALKEKFDGHWYPEKPFKGSAFRCLKTGDPVDAVFEKAARESGVPITDILEHLPSELAVWVDPGEVSYRIGEKGSVKILYSEGGDVSAALHAANHAASLAASHATSVPDDQADREIIRWTSGKAPGGGQVGRTFNPEAQAFRPGDSQPGSPLPPEQPSPGFKAPPSPPPPFLHRPHNQLTFTTAAFAQTKFGSTKLKSNSKRPNRMSPTEFSNYIKQRAALQQQAALASPGRSGSPEWGPREPMHELAPDLRQLEWPDRRVLELGSFPLPGPYPHLLVAN